MNEVTQLTPLQPLREAAAEMQAIADAILARRKFQPPPAQPKPLPRRPSIVAAEIRAVECEIDMSAPYSDDSSVVSKYERMMSRLQALRAEYREVSGPHTDPESVVDVALMLADEVLRDQTLITAKVAKLAMDVKDRTSGIDMDALRQRVSARHYAVQAALTTKGGAL